MKERLDSGRTPAPRAKLSLATELFPGLNPEPVMELFTEPVRFLGGHTIVLLPAATNGALDGGSHGVTEVEARARAWMEAGGDAARVVALHVGIADALDAQALERLRALFPSAALLTNFGVGLNHLDLDAARALGFHVTNTPGVLTEATADVALLLLLMVSRRALDAAVSLRERGGYEGWKPSPEFMGSSLAGKRMGIVGLGRIGEAFAQRARAVGMEVVALARTAETAKPAPAAQSPAGKETPLGVTPVPPIPFPPAIPRLAEEEFLSTCDVVSLHCPLTPQTRGWLDARRLELLKPGAILINTARGEIVEEAALAQALQQGRLGGAGLDVFQGEPVLSEALRQAPRLLVLPHVGSATWETRRAMGRLNFSALESFLQRRFAPEPAETPRPSKS